MVLFRFFFSMTIMSCSRRFYVGNLSTEVKDNDITKLFGKFGAVDKIEIKNKTDVEGNILTTFAFVSMNEITEDNVAKCIQSTSSSHVFTNFVTTNLRFFLLNFICLLFYEVEFFD